MPPLPRCGPPTWEKEGRTHIPRWNEPIRPCRPACSLAPSCRLRASPRAFADGVCACVCPVRVTAEVETWEDEEGRKEGTE